MNSKRKFAGFGACLLSVILLFTACDSKSEKLSVKEAETIIQELLGQQEASLVSELNEITPPEVWSETKHQIFKDSSSLETFVVAEGKAAVLGNGFGAYGVTSVVPYDINNDGTMDLVYAYSFGSGIHRSLVSCMDLSTMSERGIRSKNEHTGFRTEDLILKREGRKIIAYQIDNKQNKQDVNEALLKYPSKKDIQSMKLKQDSVLFLENNQLFYEAVDVK
ncbi:hypothetical protein [Paenibacillus pedocola]|uniref:hypothetical protein n=1 Tax=Paenibacillus pedocola TaxID=3242193 RepID=UPI002877B2B9|nr:hypothetical protein [Paenibacillus typhae]